METLLERHARLKSMQLQLAELTQKIKRLEDNIYCMNSRTLAEEVNQAMKNGIQIGMNNYSSIPGLIVFRFVDNNTIVPYYKDTKPILPKIVRVVDDEGNSRLVNVADCDPLP